jgi:hypothetical protein
VLKPTGVTITPQRPTEGDFGESDWDDLTPIENVVVVTNSPSAAAGEAGKVYSQDGSLFVPRGSDLRNGDRFPYQGKAFGVVGDAQWDMNHPFSNSNLGYVEYTIRLGG